MYDESDYVQITDDGLEVILCPDSAKNGSDSVVNPLNTRGVVTILADDLAGVEWANGSSNLYHFEDLLIAPELMEGDQVKIDSSSIFATYRNAQNPHCLGTLVEIESDEVDGFNMFVKWNNGRTNIYRYDDLERVELPNYGLSPFDSGAMKEGDSVAISSDSEYYQENDTTNPIDEVGEVLTLDAGGDDLKIIVEWNNRSVNAYNRRDLTRLKKGVGYKLSTNAWLELPNVQERAKL